MSKNCKLYFQENKYTKRQCLVDKDLILILATTVGQEFKIDDGSLISQMRGEGVPVREVWAQNLLFGKKIQQLHEKKNWTERGCTPNAPWIRNENISTVHKPDIVFTLFPLADAEFLRRRESLDHEGANKTSLANMALRKTHEQKLVEGKLGWGAVVGWGHFYRYCSLNTPMFY